MIQSIKRAFDILEYISSNGNLVRLNDIAQSTGLQNTTVHNILGTLKELGIVEQDEISPRYKVSPKIADLYFPEKTLYELKVKIKPILEKLTEEIEETTYFAIQLGSYFRYELKSEPNRKIRIALELGKEEEMIFTAIGKVFMAFSPHLFELHRKKIAEMEAGKMQKTLRAIFEEGYAMDFEEYEKDLNCIAVPYLVNGKILGVVGVAGPAFRFDRTKMRYVADKVKILLNKN